MNPAGPLIIAVAPNGARKTREDHPAIPLSAEETAREAAACCEAGAAMIHLHVRDADLRHSLDAAAYREATAAVRREAGDRLIIQMTTESVGIYGPQEQMAAVREVRPEAVSLALREICPDEDSLVEAAPFLEWLAAERIMPQYIIYSLEDLARFAALRGRGVVPGERPFLIYVLGRYTEGQVSAPGDLLPFLAAAEEPAPDWAINWAICAFGRREAACALTAAALGGHVRVGFENNMYLANGDLAPDNAALVAQVADGAALLGRDLADAATARNILEKS